MNKKTLSERDICSKFITPALVKAGWDLQTQIHEEVNLTKGKCDTLEAQLRQTRTLGAHLLDSTLHHLLAA